MTKEEERIERMAKVVGTAQSAAQIIAALTGKSVQNFRCPITDPIATPPHMAAAVLLHS